MLTDLQYIQYQQCYIYLMSTKSCVFKPDDNTLLPLMFDHKITISTAPILQTYKALYLVFRKIYAYRQKGRL